MARKGIASIGVDVGAREVRAVEVSADGRTVKHFASAILPAFGDRGMATDVNLLAEGLRNVFRDLGASTKSAVLGVPPAASTTRVLDIPNVPDSELKPILEGEVQHYGILRGFGGMFDYMKIERPADAKATGPQALVMACEAVQLNALRDATERARIEKSAIEPTMLGLIRLAASHNASGDPVLLVAVSGDTAEIAFSSNSRLLVYRRLELAAEPADDSFLRGMSVESEDVVPAFLREEAGSGVGHQLVLELKRTLDYVKREYSTSNVGKVVLAVSSPKEAPLQEVLAEGLEMPVELARAPIPGDNGLKYSAAYGLAIGSAFTNLGVPTFDLSPFDPVAEESQRQQRTLAFALTSSILIVLASVVMAFLYARQANLAENELAAVKEEQARLEREELPNALARQAKLEEYRTLSTFGVPVPQVVDSLHQTLDSRTGLSNIDINGSSLAVAGEAADEASMIQTLEQIRMQPGFHNAFIESFDQSADQVPKVVRFRMTAQLGGGAK